MSDQKELRDRFYRAYCAWRPRPKPSSDPFSTRDEGWVMGLGYAWQQLLGTEDEVFWDDLLTIPEEKILAAIETIEENIRSKNGHR